MPSLQVSVLFSSSGASVRAHRYMQDHNARIEQAFSNREEDARIDIEDRELRVTFTQGSTFALQRDVLRQKERAVRRVVKTAQEINEMHRRMQAQESQISGEEMGVAFSAGETAPAEFFCPITQDVMREPVCTVDGHTYERIAIERWFVNHNTCALAVVFGQWPSEELSSAWYGEYAVFPVVSSLHFWHVETAVPPNRNILSHASVLAYIGYGVRHLRIFLRTSAVGFFTRPCMPLF